MVATLGSLDDTDDEQLENATTTGPCSQPSVGTKELTITTLDIKMPPKLTRRGRPKGSEKTVKKTVKKRHQWFCNTCKIDSKSSEQGGLEN